MGIRSKSISFVRCQKTAVLVVEKRARARSKGGIEMTGKRRLAVLPILLIVILLTSSLFVCFSSIARASRTGDSGERQAMLSPQPNFCEMLAEEHVAGQLIVRFREAANQS